MVAAFAAYITSTVGPCVRVAPGAAITFRRVQRLFFLAEGQDMTRFLVTKLGVVKYPPYRRDLPIPFRSLVQLFHDVGSDFDELPGCI